MKQLHAIFADDPQRSVISTFDAVGRLLVKHAGPVMAIEVPSTMRKRPNRSTQFAQTNSLDALRQHGR
jgi:hypothetical protein